MDLRGEHDPVIPHLTIGDGGRSAELSRATMHVGASLPIRDTATEVRLMVGSHEAASWKTAATFQLGSGQQAVS